MLPLAFTLFGCPGEDCIFETKGTRIEDLAKIEPVQEVYNVGDTLTFSAAIPSHINNFNGNGNIVNLFQETSVTETLLGGLDLVEKLKENDMEIVEGTKAIIEGTQVAYVSYYPASNDYRFKVRVIFTHTGNYALAGFNVLRMVFDADSDCTIYSVVVGTQGVDQTGDFNFTVEE